jgi:hypothetical protein
MHKMIAAGSLFLLAAFAVACSGKMSFTTTPPGTTTTGSSNQGGGTPREALFEKDLGVLDDVNATLANVKNQNDLNAAKPRLTEFLQKHKSINEDANQLGDPTPQEKAELARKYGERAKAAKLKLNEQMVKVLNIAPNDDMYRQLVDFNRSF